MGAGDSKTKETHLKMEKLRSPMRLYRKLSRAVCLENGQKKYVTAVFCVRSPQIVENVGFKTDFLLSPWQKRGLGSTGNI